MNCRQISIATWEIRQRKFVPEKLVQTLEKMQMGEFSDFWSELFFRLIYERQYDQYIVLSLFRLKFYWGILRKIWGPEMLKTQILGSINFARNNLPKLLVKM